MLVEALHDGGFGLAIDGSIFPHDDGLLMKNELMDVVAVAFFGAHFPLSFDLVIVFVACVWRQQQPVCE